ncbi:MAG: hypothetical protein PHZ23_15945 [Acidiphilium sp.]|nr:hypothetical protein [Acidiphilium sp.]
MAIYPSYDLAPPMAVGGECTYLADFSAALAAMIAVYGTALTIASFTVALAPTSPQTGLVIVGSTLNATSTGVLLRLSASAAANYVLTVTPTLSNPTADVDPRTILVPVLVSLG